MIHRCEEHEISSLGASVEVGDQGNLVPELLQPENIGTTTQVEPTVGEHDQGNQMPGLPTQEEPRSKEPEVPTGAISQQVEVDEVKGSEVRTEEDDKECKVCHHFLSSNAYRHSHLTRYHKKLLKLCKLCKRWFMFPWDFNGHLDSLHRKCDKCQLYMKDDEQLRDHMEIKHPTAMSRQVEVKSQVTQDPVTQDTSRQDHQVKCKYCDRHFASVTECNMHVNIRHKKVACPKCEKHFVKQADCDNHFRDVHKFVCSLKGCSVFKCNELELHEHMRYEHESVFVF